MKQRENGLDYLRLICAFLVVSIHSYSLPFKVVKKIASDTGVKDWVFYLMSWYRPISEVAVPIFMLISGAFVLAASSTKDYKTFYKKSCSKLVLPTIIFSVIYFIYNTIEHYFTNMYGYGTGKDALLGSCKKMLMQWLTGKPADHLWYMYMLIGLYLIAPFLVLIKENIGEKAFTKMAWIAWIWGTISLLLNTGEIYFWSMSFCSCMLGSYMLGYVAHEWAKKKSGNGEFVKLLLVAVAISTLTCVIQILSDTYTWLDFLGGNKSYNPLIVLASFFYVAAFSVVRFKKDCTYLSALTYWVYLVHGLVIVLFVSLSSVLFGMNMHGLNSVQCLLFSIALAAIVYAVSLFVSHLIELGLKKTAKKGA